ncbi:hypothetical protein G6F68_021548 [Rhizopus microsporus]|nr:hypothetical protein G6F68_021548 [Rhizopus microsporus]
MTGSASRRRAALRVAACRARRCRPRPSGTLRRSIPWRCRCRARNACPMRRSCMRTASTWPPTRTNWAMQTLAARPRTTST